MHATLMAGNRILFHGRLNPTAAPKRRTTLLAERAARTYVRKRQDRPVERLSAEADGPEAGKKKGLLMQALGLRVRCSAN
jgi:hypothetical protein